MQGPTAINLAKYTVGVCALRAARSCWSALGLAEVTFRDAVHSLPLKFGVLADCI